MIQGQSAKQKASSILVLSNHESDFLQMRKLLCHYFPSAKQGQIHLDTKYYLADVEILRRNWPEQVQITTLPSEGQQQASNSDPNDKQDLLILLANPEDSFPSQTYDYVINQYNPENFILIVNTKDKLMPWTDEERISNEVNNFIEVIKENLEVLNQNPPERTKKGLLTDYYEDGSIFNVLQLIQTTPWSKITRKTFEKNEMPKVEPQIEPIPPAKQPTQSQQRPEKKEQLKPQGEEGQQMTDQQLQKEMNAFESMMGQMLNLRAAATQGQKLPDNDRKKKAEDLMKKLVGGWM